MNFFLQFWVLNWNFWANCQVFNKKSFEVTEYLKFSSNALECVETLISSIHILHWNLLRDILCHFYNYISHMCTPTHMLLSSYALQIKWNCFLFLASILNEVRIKCERIKFSMFVNLILKLAKSVTLILLISQTLPGRSLLR